MANKTLADRLLANAKCTAIRSSDLGKEPNPCYTGRWERHQLPKGDLSMPSRTIAGIFLAVLTFTSVSAGREPQAAQSSVLLLRPFSAVASLGDGDGVQTRFSHEALTGLRSLEAAQRVELPLTGDRSIELELERFDVVAPNARFTTVAANGTVERARPDVVLLRGQVVGEPGSRVFLSATGRGIVNGYVQREEGQYFISSVDTAGFVEGVSAVQVHAESGGGMPEFAAFCGVGEAHDVRLPALRVEAGTDESAAVAAPLLGAPRVVRVAVDADQAYVNLFDGDVFAAEAYIVQLIGAVSDIYIRDLDMKLVLTFVRTWPFGGEPFGADNISGFRNYWVNNEDITELNLVHLFSGRRDTPYGGIAYLTDPCNGFFFGISAFLLGSFPSPVVGPHLGNWDVVVVAHEMGHNMGTGHTHDSYTPAIDQCASGITARSTIMSYCHTTPGGLLNTDMRFHRRVQEVIENNVTFAGCLWFDCNGNGIDDAEDILSGTSPDVNSNGIPDECEDCNGNGILDSVEIAGGLADVNGNGIPDVCEADCNGNGIPDEHEITLNPSLDLNGNLILDACEPDCDGNGIADHVDISTGTHQDVDRDSVPDVCQDCNGNGIADYIDTDRQRHIFIGELADYVREHHGVSGVGIRNLATGGIVQDVYDVTFGPDRQLYAASFGNDRIVRIDVDAGTASVFVATGSGGLDGPAGLAFGPNGNLFVASQLNHKVVEYDGATGAVVGDFVIAGSGGLTGPFALTFSPTGRLLVSGTDNTVREYSGLNGAFLRVLVTAGSGGLSSPRSMTFAPGNRLLVSSFNTSSVLEYHGSTGAFVRVFNDALPPTGAWGVRIGTNGNVFVVRNTGAIRVLEYDVISGVYIRSFIRGESALISPTGIAFRGPSPNDCNGNGVPDDCDISSGTSLDCQPNGIPDECEIASGSATDINGNGIPDECECTQAQPVMVASAGPCLTSDDCVNLAECVGGTCYVPKNRYISFDARAVVPAGEEASIRITHPASGRSWWLAAHDPGDPADLFRLGGVRHCADWSSAPALLQVADCGIVPDAQYVVEALHCACAESDAGSYSPPRTFSTVPRPAPKHWADAVGRMEGGAWTPPNGVVNFDDVASSIARFQGLSTAPPASWVDLHDQAPNAVINFSDIQLFVLGFVGEPYPFAEPVDCP